MEEFFAQADRRRQLMQAEYERLRQDAPKRVNPGDLVIVAAGLLGRGHLWIRAKAAVLQTSGENVLVQFERPHFDGTPDQEWIDGALIVGVITPGEEE